jgi:nitrogen fixation NifU-like protein
MFSAQLLDHFQNPRNAGEVTNPTASVEVSNPVCGDILRVTVRVEKGRIVEAKFLCRGCTTSIACASRLTELLIGKTAAEAQTLDAQQISASFGDLPPETFHGAHLAADAAQTLAMRLPLDQ